MGKWLGESSVFLRPIFNPYSIQEEILGSKISYMCVLEILKSEEPPSLLLQAPSK